MIKQADLVIIGVPTRSPKRKTLTWNRLESASKIVGQNLKKALSWSCSPPCIPAFPKISWPPSLSGSPA
ncbi:MAG: hypothetical protein NTV68_05985 [Methanomicrobiales archaeon]|nr:hypothetical protein [Methanomicrobiales archaeon]